MFAFLDDVFKDPQIKNFFIWILIFPMLSMLTLSLVFLSRGRDIFLSIFAVLIIWLILLLASKSMEFFILEVYPRIFNKQEKIKRIKQAKNYYSVFRAMFRGGRNFNGIFQKDLKTYKNSTLNSESLDDDTVIGSLCPYFNHLGWAVNEFQFYGHFDVAERILLKAHGDYARLLREIFSIDIADVFVQEERIKKMCLNPKFAILILHIARIYLLLGRVYLMELENCYLFEIFSFLRIRKRRPTHKLFYEYQVNWMLEYSQSLVFLRKAVTLFEWHYQKVSTRESDYSPLLDGYQLICLALEKSGDREGSTKELYKLKSVLEDINIKTQVVGKEGLEPSYHGDIAWILEYRHCLEMLWRKSKKWYELYRFSYKTKSGLVVLILSLILGILGFCVMVGMVMGIVGILSVIFGKLSAAFPVLERASEIFGYILLIGLGGLILAFALYSCLLIFKPIVKSIYFYILLLVLIGWIVGQQYLSSSRNYINPTLITDWSETTFESHFLTPEEIDPYDYFKNNHYIDNGELDFLDAYSRSTTHLVLPLTTHPFLF